MTFGKRLAAWWAEAKNTFLQIVSLWLVLIMAEVFYAEGSSYLRYKAFIQSGVYVVSPGLFLALVWHGIKSVVLEKGRRDG